MNGHMHKRTNKQTRTHATRTTHRVSDVQPGAALMLWGEKPTVPSEKIAAMRYVLLRTISPFRLIDSVCFDFVICVVVVDVVLIVVLCGFSTVYPRQPLAGESARIRDTYLYTPLSTKILCTNRG